MPTARTVSRRASIRTVHVRPGTVADAREVADVNLRAWTYAYGHVVPPDRLAAVDVEGREQLHTRAAEAGNLFVVEQSGEIVGYVALGRSSARDAPGGEVYAIYVAPEALGTGAGTALMERAEEELRARGYESAILYVLDDNPRARRFYERQGWELDGATKSDDLLGVPITTVRYRRTL